jgi:hypothetical protein
MVGAFLRGVEGTMVEQSQGRAFYPSGLPCEAGRGDKKEKACCQVLVVTQP